MISSPDKTLVIRFGSVGDIVLSSLLLRTFRMKFPSSRLDFAVKEEYADLVRYNPHVSGIITFPRNGTVRDLRKLRASIKDEQYDLIIDIHDNLRSRYLAAGARNVLRINKRKFARFLLVKFNINRYASLGGAPSVALRYLEPVGPLGVDDDGNGLEIFFGQKETKSIDTLVTRSGCNTQETFIGVCPSAKHRTKMWPWERFADVAVQLWRDHRQPVALFGSEDEKDMSAKIENRIAASSSACRVLNLTGRINLLETAAMMDRCSVVVSNDSGLMHLAAARKRKIVAIFGPTVRELGFFPFGSTHIVVENTGLTCRPCTHIGLPSCPKTHFRCMNEIGVDQVGNAAEQLLRAR